MGQMIDLIGAQRTAAACVIGPAKHSGLKEGAVEDQLPAAFEQVEQADPAFGSFKLVLLFDRHPWHPATFRGQGIARTSESFFLNKHPLTRGIPLLGRHDRRRLHGRTTFYLLPVFLFACCHISSPSFSEAD